MSVGCGEPNPPKGRVKPNPFASAPKDPNYQPPPNTNPPKGESVKTGVELNFYGASPVTTSPDPNGNMPWRATVSLKNVGKLALIRPKVKITLTFDNGDPKIERTVDANFWNVGRFTVNELSPGQRSLPGPLDFSLPANAWRRDMNFSASFESAEKLDTQFDLRNCNCLFAFVMTESPDKILATFKERPELFDVVTFGSIPPLLYAVVRGDIPLLEKLEKLSGHLISEPSAGGYTALHLAALSTPAMASYVSKRGIKGPPLANTLLNPYIIAVQQDNPKVIPALGADSSEINAGDVMGMTALHYATESGSGDCVKALVAAGASFKTYDRSGASPFVLGMNRPTMLPLLRKLGADINDADPTTGNTPLHFAVIRSRALSAEWLIQNGAKIDAKNREGKTPLDLTEQVQHPVDRQVWAWFLKAAKTNRKVHWRDGLGQ